MVKETLEKRGFFSKSGVKRRNYMELGRVLHVGTKGKKTIPPRVFGVDHQSNRMLGTHLTVNSILAPVYWYSRNHSYSTIGH